MYQTHNINIFIFGEPIIVNFTGNGGFRCWRKLIHKLVHKLILASLNGKIPIFLAMEFSEVELLKTFIFIDPPFLLFFKIGLKNTLRSM